MVMAVTIYPATVADSVFILKGLADLDVRFRSKHRLYGGWTRDKIQEYTERHCLLVAEDSGYPVGFVGGFVYRHHLNDKIICLTEACWWIEPGERRAALALLDAFLAWGRWRGVDWITFSLMASSPAGARALERRGFRMAETVYLKES